MRNQVGRPPAECHSESDCRPGEEPAVRPTRRQSEEPTLYSCHAERRPSFTS